LERNRGKSATNLDFIEGGKSLIGNGHSPFILSFSRPLKDSILSSRAHSQWSSDLWAFIQRQDSILAWSVILSVHDADPIAEVKLLISPFFCADFLIMKSITGVLNNSNLHAIISTSLIINLH
jgi:hypothetical protein